MPSSLSCTGVVTCTSKKAIGNFYCTMHMNSHEKQCVTIYYAILPHSGMFGSHSIMRTEK